MSTRRPVRRTRTSGPTTPTSTVGGRSVTLLLLVAVATMSILMFRLLTGNLNLTPNLSNLDQSTTLLIYYGLFVFAASPLSLLLAIERSPIPKTQWDRAFFRSSTCLFMYILVLVGFALTVITAMFGKLPGLDLSAMNSDPVIFWPFWVILFSMPLIFINGPIIAAAHAEKHGLEKGGGMGYIGFGTTAAAAAYVLLKTLPLIGNFFVALVTIPAAILLILSILTGLTFGLQYKDTLRWMTFIILCTVLLNAFAILLQL
jgi:hypothetical protein